MRREPVGHPGLVWGMKHPDQPSRQEIRAQKLSTEASNCLAIAVRDSSTDFVAQLIDEAIRLAARARELRATDRPLPATGRHATPERLDRLRGEGSA